MAKGAKKPAILYDVVPWIEMGPGRTPREGERVTVEGAKAAAKEAIALAQNQREMPYGFGVRSSYVVHVGGDSGSSLLHCSRGGGFRPESVRERAHRLAFERRGGVSREVYCSPTPAFKKLLTNKKAARKKRR